MSYEVLFRGQSDISGSDQDSAFSHGASAWKVGPLRGEEQGWVSTRRSRKRKSGAARVSTACWFSLRRTEGEISAGGQSFAVSPEDL